MIQSGDEAVEAARATREDTRWSVGKADTSRAILLGQEIEALAAVMAPIRSKIAQIAWRKDALDPDLEDTLRSTSKRLQYERKQLKKMMRRTNDALSRSE